MAPSEEREVRLDAPAIEEAAGTEDFRDRRDRGSEDRSRSSLELAVPLSEPLLEEPPRNIVSALALPLRSCGLRALRTQRYCGLRSCEPCAITDFFRKSSSAVVDPADLFFSISPEGMYVS